MNTKQILAAALAASTLFTMAGPALADGGHGQGHEDGQNGQQGQHGEYEHRQSSDRFDDLQGADWAKLGIEKAYQLGFMVGQGPGKFNPQAPLRREEAVVAAIRLMGLGTEADAQAKAQLRFLDAKRVDSWAVGSVAVAVQKNVLPPDADGELRPQDDASRLWVSVLLVKALGYETEAQAKMTAQLSFKDAGQIPANLVGYVAAAVDHKLVSGYEDNTFKPTKPVTRAEMASLLGRGDGQLDDQGKRQGQLSGTVQAVNTATGTLTVQGSKGTVTAYLKSDAAIFVNGKPAALSAVTTGMTIWIKLDANMQITLVDAKSATPSDNGGGTQQQTVAGTIYSVTAPTGVSLGSITVRTNANTVTTASIAPLAKVTLGTQTLTLGDLKAGDQVKLSMIAGIVTGIEITNRASVDVSTAQGQVLLFNVPTTTSAGTLYVNLDGSAVVAYTIANGVPVVQGGVTKAYSDITAGTKIRLTLTAGAVTRIEMLP